MTPAATRSRRPIEMAAVAILLGLFYVMALSAAAQKSMTFDEVAHLTAGYSYWAFDDYRLHPENGNWPQRLAGLAVLPGSSFPSLNQRAWRTSNVYDIGDQFLHGSGNDARTLLMRGRSAIALLGVALGALVYAWARRLVSPVGAWVSLALFVFSPTLLAHGALATSDMAAALFFTAAVAATWIAFHRVTPGTVAAAAVLVGGAFLSKFSAPILIPIALVMLAVRVAAGRPLALEFRQRRVECGGRARQLATLVGVAAIIGIVTWALVWASFGFRYAAFAAATPDDAFLAELRQPGGPVGWFLDTTRRFQVLPEAYIYGFAHTLQFASERAAFLNGRFGTTGWWWYFPYAFTIKTTVPGMILGVLAVAAFPWRERFYAATPVIALVSIYSAFALTTNLNIGHRHLLPIYPALCILAGGAALWLEPLLERTRKPEPQTGRERRRQRSEARHARALSGPRIAAAAAVPLLVAWHVVESATIRPDYLAYFNQLAGGPSKGYTRLADSSLDWGQDLPALRRWLNGAGLQRPGSSAVYLSYFGTDRPEYYGIQATRLAGVIDRRPPEPPVPLGGGVYCVSATVLNVTSRLFYKPDDEREYQAALESLATLAKASENEQAWTATIRQTGERYWHELFARFDQLRTGRLMAFLRRRAPDAMAGYSILIYRLTDAEVNAALNGPPPSDP